MPEGNEGEIEYVQEAVVGVDLVEKSLAVGGATETWYAIVAAPFTLELIVVGELFVCRSF